MESGELDGEYSVEFEEQHHEATASPGAAGARAITDAELDQFLEEDEPPAAGSQQPLSRSGGSDHGAATTAESSLVIEHDKDVPAAPAAPAFAAAAVAEAMAHEPLSSSSSSSSSVHELAPAVPDAQEAASCLPPVAAAAAVMAPVAAAATVQPLPPPQQQHLQQYQEQQVPAPAAAAALAAARPSTAAPAAVHARPASASAAATRSSGHAAALLQRPASPGPARSRDGVQQQHWSPPRSAAGGGSSSNTHGFFDEGPCQQQQQQLCVLPVKQWGVPNVCDWLEVVGLGQYRKKFLHHCVNGYLLLQLRDELLKTELGIGPLGHRVLLLEAVQALQAADLAGAAAAAAAGVAPDDFAAQLPGAALSAAAAGSVLAAGLIGARAASSAPHRGSGGGGGSPKPQLLQAGSPSSSGSWAGSPDSRSGGGGSAGRRPCSAPTRRRSDANSPQVQSCPGGASLGPAAGRITVHKQRAKLLFELDRAQARAASQAGAAAQVSDVARLAAEEVARLQGQLADLDRKHRLEVQHGSGSLDGRGRIPWQHVGPGTRTADPNPERHARPWEPAELEFTYAPRISRTSAAIMAEARGESGGGGFLDRLDSDLRRRQSKMKELEQRYYSGSGSGAAGDTRKPAAADLAVVLAYLSQRGWAHLSGGADDAAAAQEMEEQLNEVVESYGKELGLGAGQQQAVLAATLPRKLAALAAAVRTQQFMDRYRADLASRDSQLKKLQDKWFAAEQSRGPGGAVTPGQRDMASAAAWFGDLGWDLASDDCDELLGALLKRAQAYKAEAERLYCIQRERQAAAGAGADRRASSSSSSGASTAAVAPAINWAGVPWSLDGLDKKMQAVLQAQADKAADAAAKAAAAKKPSAVDSTLRAAGASSAGGSAAPAASELRAKPSQLEHSVKLLSGLTVADLEQLAAASGQAKQLAVYRALRTQQFLEFTAADLAGRHAKQQALWEAFEASRRGKLVSKAELDEFYSRLQADGERRKADLAKAKADQIDREAKALALLNVANNAHNRRSRPASAARAAK